MSHVRIGMSLITIGLLALSASANESLDRFSNSELPAGQDYVYAMLEKAPDPTRNPDLGYVGGDPFITHPLSSNTESWLRGGFFMPPGSKEFRGIAVKVSRDGTPAPLEVRYGSGPGQDDLGTTTLSSKEILPLFDVWQEAQIAPRLVRPNQAIYWQIRTSAAQDPADRYLVYGPKPAADGPAAAHFALAYRVLTDRPQDRIDVPGKQYTFQHAKELLAPYYVQDSRLELRGAPPATDETAISNGWTIHYVADDAKVLATAARDLCRFLSFRAGLTTTVSDQPAAAGGHAVELVVSTDSEFRKAINTEEGYRIEVAPNRIKVLGQSPRGVMRGVYWLEATMQLRQRACLKQAITDRNCRFRRRFVTSISQAEMTYDLASHPLVYTDGLLEKISHQGFNAIWFYLNIEEVTGDSQVFPELNDPEAARRIARIKDLIARARPLGIDVIPYFAMNYHRKVSETFYAKHPDCRGVSWGNAMCTSHPEVERYLGETIEHLFKAAPGLKGLVIIFESEGFWHCGLWQQQNCPRCRDRKPADIVVEFLTTISHAMKGAAPTAELIAWSYGGAVAPPWTAEVITRLPKDTIFQTEFSKGTQVICDGVANTTEDYNISTVGPPDNFSSLYELARKAGHPVMVKTEHAISQEFITVPYIPCMRQWHARIARISEYELDGVFGNWCHYGYMPSRPAEIMLWYSWSNAPPIDDLLDQMARRDFGPQAAKHVTAAWEHITKGIQKFPYSDPIARYPGPLQKGPSQPLYLDPKIPNSGTGRAWQNDLQWTRPWGPEIAKKYLTAVADEFAAGISDLEQAGKVIDASQRQELAAELRICQILEYSLRSMVNLISWIPVRDAYAATSPGPDREELRKQLVEIAQREIANAQLALTITEADSRLGASSEAAGCRRGGMFNASLIETKIKMLQEVLDNQLKPQ